jgi:hypothetical protein
MDVPKEINSNDLAARFNAASSKKCVCDEIFRITTYIVSVENFSCK